MTTNPYSIAELATLWEREQISTEQMIGQLLARLNLLQQEINAIGHGSPPPVSTQAREQTAQQPNVRRQLNRRLAR